MPSLLERAFATIFDSIFPELVSGTVRNLHLDHNLLEVRIPHILRLRSPFDQRRTVEGIVFEVHPEEGSIQRFYCHYRRERRTATIIEGCHVFITPGVHEATDRTATRYLHAKHLAVLPLHAY